MSEKSQSDSPKPDVPNVEQLFLELLALLPGAVKRACRPYDPHPSLEEMEDIRAEIAFLMFDHDYHYLLTFEHRSSFTTWVYKVTRRHVKRRSQTQRVVISPDDVSEDSLSYEPTQEEEVYLEEMRRTLTELRSKLTEACAN